MQPISLYACSRTGTPQGRTELGMQQVITRMLDHTIAAGGDSSGGGDIQSIMNGNSKAQ
jgi:hypothetical protein